MVNENPNPSGITGIETAPAIVHELTCACGKICGKIEWLAGSSVDLEKVKAEHSTVCDDCTKNKN